MGFNYDTSSAKDSCKQGPDTFLSEMLIIIAMLSIGFLKCFRNRLYNLPFILKLMQTQSDSHYFLIFQPLTNN